MTDQQKREEALKWWNTLPTMHQVAYVNLSDISTAGKLVSKLTGREIESMHKKLIVNNYTRLTEVEAESYKKEDWWNKEVFIATDFWDIQLRDVYFIPTKYLKP